MLGLATALNSSSLKKKSGLTNKFSAELDGTGDYIDVSSLSSDIDKAAGTISMWIRIQATSGNESFFNCSDGTSSDNKLVLMYNTGSAKIEAKYRSGGTSTVAEHSIAGDDITGLGWFHLAMTYNTSTPLIQLFLNGTRVAQITSSFTQMSEDVAIDRVRLGSNSNADNTYHHGHIDEFIYIGGKDLTESEMLLLYNNGKPDDIGDLPTAIYNAIRCWLRFGDGSIDGDTDQLTAIFDNKNLTVDSDIIDNGDFSNGFTNWTNNGVDVSNGVVNFNHNSDYVFQNHGATFTVGKIYRVKTEGSGSLRFRYGFTGTAGTLRAFTVGTVLYFTADSDSNRIQFFGSASPSDATLSNVIVQKLNGNTGFCVADSTVGNNNVP